MINIQSIRTDATMTICSNLLWAGVLLPQEVAHYVAGLGIMSDNDLARTLVASRLLLDSYLQTCWSLN